MSDPSLEFLADNLLDVSGIEGLMLIDRRSGIVGTMMPSAYQNVNLEEVRQCAEQLFEILRDSQEGTDELMLDFEDVGLFIRANKLCMVCALTTPSPNVAAIRVAVKLMLRQVTEEHLNGLSSSAVETDTSPGDSNFNAGTRTAKPAPPRKPPPPASASSQPAEPVVNQNRPAEPATSPKQDKKQKKKKKESGFEGIWG